MKLRLVLLLSLVPLVLAACQDDEDNEPAADVTPTAPATSDDSIAGDDGGTVEASGTATPDEEFVEALQAADVPYNMASGNTMGAADAPLTITVFEDHQCPFCLHYTARSEPGIYDYIRSGHVRLEFSHLPILGDESVLAALAAQCAADQDKFWQYSHQLFLTQAEAGQSSNEELNVGRFSIENLEAIADQLRLDRAIFDPCLESYQHLEMLDQMVTEARTLGVTSTPSFAVNGQLVPPQSVPGNAEQWGIFIENLLEQVSQGS